MSGYHATGNDQLATLGTTRSRLGAMFRPFAPRIPVAESGITVTGATATGYTGDKAVAYNSASSLGLIDRGAKLEANGGWGVNNAAVTGAFSNPFFIEFWVSGTDVAPQFFPGVGGTAEYRIWSDGWPITPWTTLVYAAGMNVYYKINFPNATNPRLIRVGFGAAMNYAGLHLPSTGQAYANPALRPKIILIGDSYTQAGLSGASGENVGASGIASQIAMMTGADVYTCGIFGTGYVKDSGTAGVYFGSTSRLAQVATLPAADAIVVYGGGNDVLNGVTNAQMTAAALTMYNALAASRPTTPIIVAGPQSVTSDASTVAAASAALKAVALSHPQVRGYIDSTVPSLWITGTGNSGAMNGTGNADVFISPDNVHPTRAGAEYIASRIVTELAKILI